MDDHIEKIRITKKQLESIRQRIKDTRVKILELKNEIRRLQTTAMNIEGVLLFRRAMKERNK